MTTVLSGNVRVEFESESVILDRTAKVLIYEGDQLLLELAAVVSSEAGADGKRYPAVKFRNRRGLSVSNIGEQEPLLSDIPGPCCHG